MDLLDMEGETERRVLDRSSEREDMEEGELSDADEVDTSRTMAVYSPQGSQSTKPRVILERVGRALPDLLNDIGVTEFNVLDEATTVKLGARAKRFNLDSHITFAEVSRMYETLGISEKDRKPGVSNSWRLETIHVRGTELMEEEDVMDYFKDYNPLEFCRVDNMSCNVAWGTAANSGKAMLGLSRPIASSQKRKVIHRIASSEEMDQERVVVEEDVDEVEGEKPVDPADIEVAVPQGNWRIGGKHPKAEALFLRFAKVEEVGERMNFGELDARNRSLTMGGGLLSRSKRENLLAARDEQLEREQAEREKEIDGKNPWGSIAENWGSGRRREQAREYPIPLEHMDRPPRSFRIGIKDWDAPEDEFDPVRVRPPMEEGGKRKRSIKDRLQMDKRVVDEDFEESEEEAAETFISEGDDDSDIEWTKKRKRPRMGMVADMVEKKNVKDRIGGDQKQKKELIKRKIANKTSIEVFEEEEEEEVDDWEDEEEARKVGWRGREDLRLSVKLEDRPMMSLTKRLNERFRGGRLAGRLGDGVKVEVEEREVKNLGEREGRESRRQYSRDVESDGGDSLENDDGEDLKADFGNAANMVIQVNQSDDETMDVDLKYEENRGRERQKESGRNDAEKERRERDKRRENEDRDKRKEREREREKERQREKEVKEREREKRKDLERERELERINRDKKDQERELSRLKDREREKRRDRDVMEERTKRADKHRERENARQRERERERKDRDRDREREREKERERRREREKDRSKATSKSTSRKKKDESADESSEVSSDESSSDSESESESSSNSESESESSSDDSEKSSSDSESEDDRKKKKGKEAKESSQRSDSKKETSKDSLKKDDTRERKDAKAKSKDEKKSEKNTGEKKAVKKEKEENTDDKKKADELRNKLKNYLQAAQAAKEKKKDAEK